MIKAKTVSFGNEEYEIVPINGSLEDGEFYPSTVNVEGIEIDVDGVIWGEIEHYILGALIEKLDDLQPVDTCDPDYTHAIFINGGTIKKDVLTAVYRLGTCTTSMLETELNLEHSPSPYISKLKDDGLVACVGHVDNSQILVPTPVGVKELFCIEGTPNPYESDRKHFGKEEGGLTNLINNSGEESEKESDSASS